MTNFEIYLMQCPPGFVFCVAQRIGRNARTLDAQIGYCRGVVLFGEYVAFVGAFTRWDDATLSVAWAERADFGVMPLQSVAFEFIKIADWMRILKPPITYD